MIDSPVKVWRQQKKVTSLLNKEGRILLWTIIRVCSKSFTKQTPYPVVIVELNDKQRIIGQLVDWRKEDLVINRKVITVLRRNYSEDKEGVIRYSIKFKPS